MNSYIAEIEELEREIQESSRKLKVLKCKTFLKPFGMEHRRNFNSISKIDKILKEKNISYWHGKEYVRYLGDFELDEMITFRITDLKGENITKNKIKYEHAGKIHTAEDRINLELYNHQNEAIKDLTQLSETNSHFKTLLVLPTGAGKTLTAVYWLLKHYTNQNKKILWIAHRHELLEQAKKSFINLAYSELLTNRSSFNYRVISGLHDRAVNIENTDDVIIASKDSLNKGCEYLEKWISQEDDVILVIDEAHHATAKTYRKIIDNIAKTTDNFKLLGLTATPFRTAENEQGLLKKVFLDDIVYKIDLRELISIEILSKPNFEELKTHFDITKELDEKTLDRIKYFDIDSIGEGVAETIAKNKDRNHFIVKQYIENKDKYKQTLVFALNIDNALALNALFQNKGVKSDYVVSAIKDATGKINVAPKENQKNIKKFREGDLEVLINVNILTEGMDLPETQTIFLTRPTISSILMTQMIGRGLRGPKAGGSEELYIVSFIDEWKDKIAWVNPENLLIEEGAVFPTDSHNNREIILRLISIAKIEEFAKIMDRTVDAEYIESLEFMDRIPIGLISFSILKAKGEEENEKNCRILVYDNIFPSYTNFLNSLPEFFKEHKLENQDFLAEEELESLSKKIENRFFYDYDKYPGYYIEDIKDILFYYAQHENIPIFLKLEDRDDLDITKLADEICEKDMGPKKKKDFLDESWDNDKNKWEAFFGYDKKYFISEVDLAINKIVNPEQYITIKKPFVDEEERKYEKLSMNELREFDPEYCKKLSDAVYNKYTDEDGYYYSAMSGKASRSKYKFVFEIDHIIPISKGGLTKFDNLQLLTSEENKIKRDQMEGYE
ncbi:MAG: DEAD/DEAH box helicase family protein [Methanobacteriaceae archaeon]